MATGTSGSTRGGIVAAIVIATALMAYTILSADTDRLQFWELIVPLGVIGGIVLGGMMVGGLLENSHVESAVVRSILVALAALAAGYLIFALIGLAVFAVVTSG